MEGRINSLWAALTTITAFDTGTSTRSTARLHDSESRQRERQLISYNLSASLCIESLLQQVCAMTGGDADQKQRIYTVVCNQLRQLKVIDDSYNMKEFEPLRIQYQDALCQLINITYATIVNEESHQLSSIVVPVVPERSRYRREFRELSFIANGGFGCVYKAVHFLDGVEYAIKKISVKFDRLQCIEQHLQEVKTLARLNHTNIVSYKSAWIESAFSAALNMDIPAEEETGSSRMIEPSRSILTESECSHIVFDENPDGQTGMRERTWTDICIDENSGERGAHSKMNEGNDFSVMSEKDSEAESKGDSSEGNAVGGFRCTVRSSDTDSDLKEENMQLCRYVRQQPDTTYATLYIQMSLCENTLQQWLDKRVELLSDDIVMNIFTQIVQGLDHIHQRRIVHHDIKPRNIFISTIGNLQIQLGDFGLACPLQGENHENAFGTYLYAAPEQLARKCDPKSDIYSAGIVLLELLVPTSTLMERYELVKRLKAGVIPDTVKEHYPKWVDILPKLVHDEPSKRPSASELLIMLNEEKDARIQELRENVTWLQDKITTLENQLSLLQSR